MNTRNSRRGFLAAAAVAPVAFSSTTAYSQNADNPTAVDIGFCSDMSVHHLQALAMCQRVLGRDTGDSVQAAAAEVLMNQAIEVGQMRAWLTDWGASTVPPTTVMGWMGANNGEGMPLAMMPGYASKEELLELSTREGTDRGKRWLELMRAHHVGGVNMALQAQALASSEKVIRLATIQVTTQTYEISLYDQLLASQYG